MPICMPFLNIRLFRAFILVNRFQFLSLPTAIIQKFLKAFLKNSKNYISKPRNLTRPNGESFAVEELPTEHLQN